MKKTVLSQEELASLKQIRESFDNLTTVMGSLEIQITLINLEKEEVIDQIKLLKQQEIQLGTELKEKYGDGFEFYHQTSDAFFNENREKYKGKHLLAVVDGDHSPAGLRRDLDNLDEMECKYIVVDDVLFLPHLGRVCEEFADQKGFAYAPINLYNGLGLLTKKWYETAIIMLN